MTDAAPLFVDTNVLIYANVAMAPFHGAALKSLQDAYQTGRPLWISRQVLREFIAARTRPQTFAEPSRRMSWSSECGIWRNGLKWRTIPPP